MAGHVSVNRVRLPPANPATSSLITTLTWSEAHNTLQPARVVRIGWSSKRAGAWPRRCSPVRIQGHRISESKVIKNCGCNSTTRYTRYGLQDDNYPITVSVSESIPSWRISRISREKKVTHVYLWVRDELENDSDFLARRVMMGVRSRSEGPASPGHDCRRVAPRLTDVLSALDVPTFRLRIAG